MKPIRPRSRGQRPPAPGLRRLALDLVDHLDAMVAYWNHEQVCVFANHAYRSWFGKGRAEVVGSTLRELLGADLYERNLPYLRAAYAGAKQVFERDIPIPGGDGVRPSLATYIPHLVGGRVKGLFVHVADVTPLKRLQQELRAAKEQAERLATHDFLTGLPNRALLLAKLQESIALAARGLEGLAVLTIDIDNFKAVNDTHGHGSGDCLLIEIATRLRHALREYDTVARFAGDEFVLLVPEIGGAAPIESIAERILESARPPVAVDGARVSPTLSIGIALYPQHGLTPEALLRSSDRALYRAKRLGKNRYALAV